MRRRGIRIIWITWHPNHYNDYLFSEISKIKGIKLEVYYLKKVLKKYPWSNSSLKNFDNYFAPYYKMPWFNYLSAILSRKVNLVVIAGWNNINHIISFILLGILQRKFIIWSDTPKVIRERKGVKNYFRTKYLNHIFTKAYLIFATGKPGVEAFKGIGVESKKLINFPFVTNTNFFKPNNRGSLNQNNEIILLSSGRLDVSHKGQDLLIKALTQLMNQGFSLKLRIAGVGPDEEYLKTLCSNLGVSDFVEFLGWLEYSNLPDFYNSGDIFVHSSHFDPYPNSVLEAMACGVPVIGSDQAGSVVDRVINGYNGYIHDNNNLESLIEQILNMLKKPEMILELGINARKTALSHDIGENLMIFKNLKNVNID